MAETRGQGCPHLTFWQGHRATTWLLGDKRGRHHKPLSGFGFIWGADGVGCAVRVSGLCVSVAVKGLIVPMLWLAGRGNRETLYNTALLIEIIWHRLKSLHYFEDRHKAETFCASSISQLCQLVLFPHFLSYCFSFVLFGCCSHYRKLCFWHFSCWSNPSPFFSPFPSLQISSGYLVSVSNLSAAEEPPAKWLNGSGLFPAHLRPLIETTQEEETTIQSEEKPPARKPKKQQHFSWWPPTGSTNYVTWPSSPAPCTRSPLTPCGATPPLTCWPVATSLADSGQIFLKRWLHCVSNTTDLLFICIGERCTLMEGVSLNT